MVAETTFAPPTDRGAQAWRLHVVLWVLVLLVSLFSLSIGAAGAQVRAGLMAWIATDKLDAVSFIF